MYVYTLLIFKTTVDKYTCISINFRKLRYTAVYVYVHGTFTRSRVIINIPLALSPSQKKGVVPVHSFFQLVNK